MPVKIIDHFFGDYFSIVETITHKSISIPVFLVESYHTLNQIVGYAKYNNRTNGNVYYRGQDKLYNGLVPSLYRNTLSNKNLQRKTLTLINYIKNSKNSIKYLKYVDDYSMEPLFQHYGIKTRWIDLVDNLWVSIWFGLHEFHIKTYDREYYCINKRKEKSFNSIKNIEEDNYLYLLLVCSDAINEENKCPGLYIGDNYYAIDLRKSCPSTFLRPHAQHAILIRKNAITTLDDIDIFESVCCIIKISVKNGFNWIGEYGLISPRNLFPPVNYDYGYGILLEKAVHDKSYINVHGSIFIVSY